MAQDNTDEWAERLERIEEELGSVYEQLQEPQAALKTAGRKKDYQALNEPLERLARYGRLFGEIRATWRAPEE